MARDVAVLFALTHTTANRRTSEAAVMAGGVSAVVLRKSDLQESTDAGRAIKRPRPASKNLDANPGAFSTT
jgi:hypothetical protein